MTLRNLINSTHFCSWLSFGSLPYDRLVFSWNAHTTGFGRPVLSAGVRNMRTFVGILLLLWLHQKSRSSKHSELIQWSEKFFKQSSFSTPSGYEFLSDDCGRCGKTSHPRYKNIWWVILVCDLAVLWYTTLLRFVNSGVPFSLSTRQKYTSSH